MVRDANHQVRESASVPGLVDRTVLVIDGNEILARTTAQALSSAGTSALYATNATQALRIATGQKIDAVVIDIDLSGRISGVDLVRILGEQAPKIRMALTTSSATEEFAPPAEARLFRKPCRARDLAVALFPDEYR